MLKKIIFLWIVGAAVQLSAVETGPSEAELLNAWEHCRQTASQAPLDLIEFFLGESNEGPGYRQLLDDFAAKRASLKFNKFSQLNAKFIKDEWGSRIQFDFVVHYIKDTEDGEQIVELEGDLLATSEGDCRVF